MKRQIICGMLAAAILCPAAYAQNFDWAKTAVDYCVERGILSGMEDGSLALGDNLTREQMAKILCDAFRLDVNINREPVFDDIDQIRWSYGYIGAVAPYLFGGKGNVSGVNPAEKITREEFCATLVLCSGLSAASLRNPALLDTNFTDAGSVSSTYKRLLGVAVERGMMSGDSGRLNAKDLLTRAEACSMLYRVLSINAGTLKIQPSDLGVIQSETTMFGASTVSLSQAKAWAKRNGAPEEFINLADIYWSYGELTGIRADILYAQACKETGFGKFGGSVLPEQNNFAGIKKYGATGDATEDHDSFETPDNGVRAHFNHMSAYLGIEPIGEVHGRYNSVRSLSWAGSVKNLEELGGKWCPDLYYGFSILHNYIEPMLTVSE